MATYIKLHWCFSIQKMTPEDCEQYKQPEGTLELLDNSGMRMHMGKTIEELVGFLEGFEPDDVADDLEYINYGDTTREQEAW